MSVNAVKNPLLAISAQKKFCRAAEFGFAVYGEAGYGEEFQVLIWQPFGSVVFGDAQFGDMDLLSGIYQVRKSLAGPHTVRLKYYRPTFSESIPILASRTKFANAISYWQGLTSPQRVVYNKRAVGLHMSGYNLAIKEFMSS